MKSGICPKCGSGDIYVSSPKIARGMALYGHGIFMKRGVWQNIMALVQHYACASCDYIETYVFDAESKQNIKEEWTPFSQFNKEKEKRKRKNDEA